MKKILVKKPLSLPLTSGVEFFFRPTTFEFWIICLHVIHTLFLLLYSKGYGFSGDKWFKNQKWLVRKKIWHQKLGVMKGFFILKFFSFSVLATFWKNDCSATWKLNSFKKNLACGQLINVQRYQKHVLLLRWFISRVSYMFEPTVISITVH